MKPRRLGLFPIFAGVVVLTEEVLRHVTAGASIVASILSSQTSGFGWELLVAGAFVLCRFVALWLLPPLLVTWLVAKLWRR
jgi:hypothetical protein